MKKVYICILITAFLFATMEVVLKLAGETMDPLQLTFLRFMIGGSALFPFALAEIKKKKLKLAIKDYLYLALLGILCVPVSMLLFQLGILYSKASTAAVLFSINPMFTIIFAHFLTSERITKARIIFLILGLIGVLFMMRPWELQQGNTILGLTFTISAALTFGLYTVMGKISVEKTGIIAQTSISFIFGSLVLLIVILITDRPVIDGVAENLMLVLYISLLVTGVGYYSYFTAIKNSDAATGSFAFFIKIVIAPVIAVIVLGDQILWNTYIGIIFILIASYLNIIDKKGMLRGKNLGEDKHE